jgi:hypothetical protein
MNNYFWDCYYPECGTNPCETCLDIMKELIQKEEDEKSSCVEKNSRRTNF